MPFEKKITLADLLQNTVLLGDFAVLDFDENTLALVLRLNRIRLLTQLLLVKWVRHVRLILLQTDVRSLLPLQFVHFY